MCGGVESTVTGRPRTYFFGALLLATHVGLGLLVSNFGCLHLLINKYITCTITSKNTDHGLIEIFSISSHKFSIIAMI